MATWPTITLRSCGQARNQKPHTLRFLLELSRMEMTDPNQPETGNASCLQYEVTEEDIIGFNLYHLDHSPSHKGLHRIWRLILPPLVALYGILDYLRTGHIWSPVFFCSIAILWFIAWPTYFRWFLRRTISRSRAE